MVKSKNEVSDTQRLSQITFITNFGDFLTQFSIVKIIYLLKFDALTAAFGGVGIGSLATVCSGFLSPLIKRKVNTKYLIISSQVVSFFAVLVILISLLKMDIRSPWPFYVLLFVQTFFSKVFDAARETHTHGQTLKNESHQSVQAKLLSGFYSAQFLGPLFAFFTLKYFDPTIPIIIDLLTFCVATFFSLKLNRGKDLKTSISTFSAIAHLKNDRDLKILFLLRTFGFWIPASFFNMFIYEYAISKFKVGVEYSGVLYSILGFGALAGSLTLQNYRFVNIFRLSSKNHILASFAQMGLAITVLFLFSSDTIILGVISYLVYGFFMGINAISTQAMRRSFCKTNQLPAIIGLETICSFSIQFLLTSLVFTVFKNALSAQNYSIFIVPFCYMFTALIYLNVFKFEKLDQLGGPTL